MKIACDEFQIPWAVIFELYYFYLYRQPRWGVHIFGLLRLMQLHAGHPVHQQRFFAHG